MEKLMEAEKVHLTKEKETSLIPLYGRALESRSKDPVLRDEAAEEAVRRIDYDFGRLKLRKVEPLAVAIRAKQFDLWTSEYLADTPDATVLHLGCGLDSRVFRLNPNASVRWFDVDYPEVIEVRRRLYPERAGYRMIGSSVTDPGFLDEVPGDCPAMIVAEGLMMYLTEHDVKQLLNRLTDHFKSGRMAFDALSRWGAQLAKADPSVRATGASFRWGIDDPRDIKHLEPRLELVTEVRTPDLPGYSRLPWAMRALVRMMDPIPALRRLNRLLLYRF
jgi:O-methyltransferase involved in polyketide biosynthesis